MEIPPVSASVDFRLPVKVPITAGAFGAFSTWGNNVEVVGGEDWTIDITYINIGFGGRAAYHFNFAKKLDAYAGISLGYVIQTIDVKYGKAWDNIRKPDYKGVSFLLYGVNLGGRFFFTERLGAYLELGYSGLQVASAGITFKL
jgi:hypothetical protein